MISDTHGLLRNEAVDALSGCELIVHAGDIGSPDIIDSLRKLAPTIAIRGNVDRGEWAKNFNEIEAFEFDGKRFYLIHNIKDLNIELSGEFDAVIFGHSHKPHNEQKGSVLFFNPASAGPRRFKLPIYVGILEIDASGLSGQHFELEV